MRRGSSRKRGAHALQLLNNYFINIFMKVGKHMYMHVTFLQLNILSNFSCHLFLIIIRYPEFTLIRGNQSISNQDFFHLSNSKRDL